MSAPDWTLRLRTPAFEVTALLLGLVVGSFGGHLAFAAVAKLVFAGGPMLAWYRSLFVG